MEIRRGKVDRNHGYFHAKIQTSLKDLLYTIYLKVQKEGHASDD